MKLIELLAAVGAAGPGPTVNMNGEPNPLAGASELPVGLVAGDGGAEGPIVVTSLDGFTGAVVLEYLDDPDAIVPVWVALPDSVVTVATALNGSIMVNGGRFYPYMRANLTAATAGTVTVSLLSPN